MNTKPHAYPGESSKPILLGASTPNRHHLEHEFNHILSGMLPTIMTGLAIFYTLLSGAYLLAISGESHLIIFLLDSCTAMLFAIASLAIYRWPPPAHHINRIALAIMLIPLANCIVRLYHGCDADQSTNFALLLIGVGCISLSIRWYTIACSVILGSWGILVRAIPLFNVSHFAFLLIQAFAISLLIFIARRRSIRETTLLRLYAQEQSQTLLGANQALAQERQAAEQARTHADNANRAKSRFLSTMTHELRTPLTAILGYTELMSYTIPQQPELLDDLAKIKAAGKHLKDVINSVLDMAKIESGHLELFPTEVHIATVVHQSLMSVKPLAEHNQNTITTSIAEHLPILIADQIRLRQVLINLLANACRFTVGGTITLRVEPSRELVTVTGNVRLWIGFHVVDTGVGMTPEQSAQIFQEFVQVGSREQADENGTGLGLALSQQLIRLMGGNIIVNSQIQQGSTFSVFLPAQESCNVPSLV